MHRLARIVVLSAALSLGGCVSRLGPGGASPGIVYSNVTYPNLLNPNMSYRIDFERKDIDLLGPVRAEAESYWVLFLFSKGDSGYGRLLEQVRAKGGDGVMNVTIDTEYTSYFILYAKVKTVLTGVAYKYRREAGER